MAVWIDLVSPQNSYGCYAMRPMMSYNKLLFGSTVRQVFPSMVERALPLPTTRLPGHQLELNLLGVCPFVFPATLLVKRTLFGPHCPLGLTRI